MLLYEKNWQKLIQTIKGDATKMLKTGRQVLKFYIMGPDLPKKIFEMGSIWAAHKEDNFMDNYPSKYYFRKLYPKII